VVSGACGAADVDAADLAAAKANAGRHDWIAAIGRQDRTRIDPRYQRTANLAVSTTDPDATHLRQRDGVRLGYQDHYLGFVRLNMVNMGTSRDLLTEVVVRMAAAVNAASVDRGPAS
jgi:hypothetical protein